MGYILYVWLIMCINKVSKFTGGASSVELNLALQNLALLEGWSLASVRLWQHVLNNRFWIYTAQQFFGKAFIATSGSLTLIKKSWQCKLLEQIVQDNFIKMNFTLSLYMPIFY